jgi:thiamine biosynthesis lipoprotein
VQHMSLRKFSKICKTKLILCSIFICCFFLVSCQKESNPLGSQNKNPIQKQSRLMMGTIIEISLQHADQELCRRAMNRAFAEMSRIESIMSLYKPDSELSRINQLANKEPLKISPEMTELLRISHKVWRLTSGGFDPTASPIIKLWGFYKNQGHMPGENKIREKLKLVGFQNVLFDKSKNEVRFLLPGVKLDFNAIAKGYAVDQAVKILKTIGIQCALINAGGDIYVLGGKKPQGYWTIGIRHPVKKDKIFASIELNNRAIVTSGNYEKFFTINGKQYCHIINPHTGYPVQDILSVTVLAPQVALADALATGIFVLGQDKGLALLNSSKDINGIIITLDHKAKGGMKVYYSKNIKQKLKLNYSWSRAGWLH